MRKTVYTYKLAIQNILDNADNMDKQDILDELNTLANEKRQDSTATFRR